jgi:glyoxylase I family protein
MARIEHAAIFAEDPSRLKDFYLRAFGLRVVLDNGQGTPPGYFLGDDHGTALEIIGRPPGAENANQRYVCHVAFVVEDVAAKKAELEGMGLIFEVETAVDNDSMTTAFCNDPAANRIQIVKRKKPLGS